MSIQRLQKLIDKLNGLPTFIEKEADKTLLKNEKQLIKQNRLQIKLGVDSEGNLIEYQKKRIGDTGKYGWYSRGYERRKQNKGLNVSYVDLFFTGDFSKSLALLQMNPGEFRFISEDDEKFLFLTANYGETILGVNEEYLDYFSDNFMQPQLQEKVDKYLTV